LAASLAPDEDLGRIAQLSYDEGESSILELLDAYRVTLEGRLRTTDIRLALAEAQVDFDLAIGKEVQP
jgi:outer membrane protein TolC